MTECGEVVDCSIVESVDSNLQYGVRSNGEFDQSVGTGSNAGEDARVHADRTDGNDACFSGGAGNCLGVERMS